jgi:hypothetical protein
MQAKKFRVHLLKLAMTFAVVSAHAQSGPPVFVPQPRDPGPDVKRGVVLRLEKHRTCERCPWYEVRVFEDGATMFWGKEAVAFLGVDGSYMLPVSRIRPDVPAKLRDLLARARDAFDSTERTASANISRRESVLEENKRLNRQTIEINFNVENRIRTRLVAAGAHPGLDLLASAIESLYRLEQQAPGLAMAMAPRPVVFADPQMVVHWRTFTGTRDQCSQSAGIDTLNITVFKGGRYRAEATRALWKPLSVDADVPKIEGQLDEELTESFRRQLISERGTFSELKWTPLSVERNPTVTQNTYVVRQQQRQRILYVRLDDGRIADLTVALWDERNHKVPKWSDPLRRLADKITSQIWSRFPPPDSERVAECQRRPPGK